YELTDTITTQMSIRNSVAEPWNSEIIWANTQSQSDALQLLTTPPWDPENLSGSNIRGELSPPLKIAEMFYTENGIPINEDKTWDYTGRYNLQKATEYDQLYIKKDYTTVSLHFDREPRFYADLGFDGSIYYGQGRYDDRNANDLFYLEAKFK